MRLKKTNEYATQLKTKNPEKGLEKGEVQYFNTPLENGLTDRAVRRGRLLFE
jgi:hypothetical protein